MAVSRSFDFDQGSLGRNLATFDSHVHDFIDRDIDVHTTEGEASMKAHAPWQDHTGHARSNLWADNEKHNDRYSIHMGQGAEYGIYLEESNNGRFQIVMPTLLATARSFMRSLENMFAQMETHAPVPTVITPGVGTRPGTSQGVSEHAVGAKARPKISIDKRGRVIAKNAKGRFVSLKNFVTSTVTGKTKKTRRG